MLTLRSGLVIGSGLAIAIAIVFAVALQAGMSSTGLRGGPELAASFLFLVTLPAGVLAAFAGRFAMSFGMETAFVVTGIAWMLLSVPYAVALVYGVRQFRDRRIASRYSRIDAACGL